MNCSSDSWNVGYMSGSGIDGVEFQPFKGFFKGKARRAGCYGKLFPNQDAADQYALEHGFTQSYYKRPFAFISLNLSPATRRFLKSQPNRAARWYWLRKILGDASQDRYFKSVDTASYMHDQRNTWDDYMSGNWQVYRHQYEPKLVSA